MPRLVYLVGALILWGSCSRAESGDPIAGAVGSAARSGTSYSAELAKDLAAGSGKGDGNASTKADGSKKDAGKAADAKPGDTKVADAKAASPKPGDAKPGDAKVAAAKPGDAKLAAAPADAKPGDAKATKVAAVAPEDTAKSAKPGVVAAGDAKVAAAKPGDAKVAAQPVSAPPPEDAKAAVADPAPGEKTRGVVVHGPVRVSAELDAIKLSLLPNWDRDIDQAGTFQYVVRVKGTQATKTFRFHYGYEDPKAPTDRDAYKQYLQDAKILTDLKDRQRGGVWFLEGKDGAGLPAFRFVVLYGSKRLICYGSSYRDADSSRLGDDRDQTVIQAKQICETVAL